jgi:hypothetical protein
MLAKIPFPPFALSENDVDPAAPPPAGAPPAPRFDKIIADY